MLREITWIELQEWMAYAMLDPFTEERADARAASICTMLANINRDSKTNPDPFQVSDWLMHFGDSEPPPKKEVKQTWQQQKALMRAALSGSQKTSPKRKRVGANGD